MKSDENESIGLNEICLIGRLFRTDLHEFRESLTNLKDKDLLLSVPINIKHGQYLFVIAKSKDGKYCTKFCKGPSFMNEVIKEIKDCPRVYHVGYGKGNILEGTTSLNRFFNRCLVDMYPEEYKAFKDFVKKDFLISVIQDYILGDKKRKTLKDYIKFRLNRMISVI